MEPLVYSPKDLAKLLKMSPNHVYGLIARGEIRAVRLGRKLVVPRHELVRVGLLPREGDMSNE